MLVTEAQSCWASRLGCLPLPQWFRNPLQVLGTQRLQRTSRKHWGLMPRLAPPDLRQFLDPQWRNGFDPAQMPSTSCTHLCPRILRSIWMGRLGCPQNQPRLFGQLRHTSLHYCWRWRRPDSIRMRSIGRSQPPAAWCSRVDCCTTRSSQPPHQWWDWSQRVGMRLRERFRIHQ